MLWKVGGIYVNNKYKAEFIYDNHNSEYYYTF